MKFAVIDIGSNTAKAEIYKYKDGILELRKKYTERDRVAEHKQNGVLDDDGIKLLCNIMKGFRNICMEEKIKKIFAFATQSLRGIENADDVCGKIYASSGIRVEIITGELEAELGFEAFRAENEGACGVLSDMGGGSTEITFFDETERISSDSLPFGSASLSHTYGADVLTSSETEQKISSYIASVMSSLPKAEGCELLYTTGGTALGFFKLFSADTQTKANLITTSSLTDFYKKCKAEPDKARKRAQELLPDRYDTVYTGLFAHLCICRYLGVKAVIRCKTTCRRGYAQRLVAKGAIK